MDSDDRVTYYSGNRAPNIVRTLSSQDAGEFDVVAGQSFKLRVRPEWSDTVVLDVSMIADLAADTLTYVPQAGDFDDEGIYKAWVYITLSAGVTQDTDEFEILVLQHAPGEGTRVGAVWRACRELEPIAWDALRAYDNYGDPGLQRVIELAKLRVIPAAMMATAANEIGLDPRVVDYLAKKVLVDNVLSAAISFWTNQVVQQTARGNSEEVVTYPDRIKAAENAILRYRGDLERQWPEVEIILGPTTNLYDAPAVNDCGPTLTPGLDEYSPMPITVPRLPYYGGWRGTR
jgi:hypothetical protein